MQLHGRRLHFSSIVKLVHPSSDLTGAMTSPICPLADKCSSSRAQVRLNPIIPVNGGRLRRGGYRPGSVR